MDKNTWIGFLLIALIIIGFSVWNRPSEEELQARRHYQDSIALVHQLEYEAQQASKAAAQLAEQNLQSQDSAALLEQVEAQYGALAVAAHSFDNQMTVMENEVLRLTIESKGGRVAKAELKNYKTYGDTVNNLILFSGADADLNFTLFTQNNRIINTRDLYFTPQAIETDTAGNQVLRMRLKTNGEQYLDFVYTLSANDYMVDFNIESYGMNEVLAQNQNYIDFDWTQAIRQQERGRKFEERYAQLQYMFTDGDVEKLSESKNDSKQITARLRWIAFKDQFFSTVLIADNDLTSTKLQSELMPKNSGYIKRYTAHSTMSFDPSGKAKTHLRWYFGPNHYNTLKAYDKGVDKAEKLRLKTLVPLGWKIVAWINMWLVIPMFDLFTSWGMNIGLVILLMTLVIKLIILPFTFTSYRSSAKMRVLKPQMDEINEKYPPEKMQERQQATMALYQRAGVSPMSGCLPLIFQMPVLMAMFWFFPTAIELRGQSFLWAEDLSTYDAIISWNAQIPLISWALNNHISLFCLLMTLTNFGYTYLNMQTQAGGNDPTQKMMRWMMYLMPLFFFFIFNDYAAGLSYYYFVSLLMTIIQTWIFRWSIDDKKLLAQMEANAAKRGSKAQKKSGFMARLEKMQREQQAYMREEAKRRAKR